MISVLPTDVREAQKIKRLRFTFLSSFPVLVGKPPELNPARLLRMEAPNLPKPLSEALSKTVCVSPMLEAEINVVRIANEIDLGLRILPAPDVHQRSKA
jgi:hypothetical protein